MTTNTTIKALRDALTGTVAVLETLDTIRHVAADFPALDNARKVLALTADASEDAPPSIASAPGEAPIPVYKHHDNGTVSFVNWDECWRHGQYTIAARPALVGAVQAADGWQWVPKVPTDAMLNALSVQPDIVGRHIVRYSVDKLPDAYAAMLAAAPAAPIAEAPVKRRDIHAICDAYESGMGHGLQLDGHKSGTIFGNPEHGKAYELGYEEGEERARDGKAHPAATHAKPEAGDGAADAQLPCIFTNADDLFVAMGVDDKSIAALERAAARYEYIRCLHPCDFEKLVSANIAGKGKFDDLVDQAIAANKAGA